MFGAPLFLSDVSGTEILVIMIFVLMFFGSKSIPGIARSLGRAMRQIKDASNEIQNEIKQSGIDIKKDMNLQGFVRDAVEDIQRPLDQYTVEINEAIKYEPPRKSSIPAEPVSVDQIEVKSNQVEQEEMVKSEKAISTNNSPEQPSV